MKLCLKKKQGYVCCLNVSSFVLCEAEDNYIIGKDKRTVEEKDVDFFL